MDSRGDVHTVHGDHVAKASAEYLQLHDVYAQHSGVDCVFCVPRSSLCKGKLGRGDSETCRNAQVTFGTYARYVLVAYIAGYWQRNHSTMVSCHISVSPPSGARRTWGAKPASPLDHSYMQLLRCPTPLCGQSKHLL